MATAANLRNATTFASRADNLFYPSGKTVADADLTRLQDALRALYPYPGGGAWPSNRPDANDVAALLYKTLAGMTTGQERRVSEAAVTQPSAFGS